MTTRIDPIRRRLLAGLAASLVAPGLLAAETRRTVRVLTSYPDAVVARFESAFEAAHPEYRLQFVWRMPHDAQPYLEAPGQNGVDVYWAASPRVFSALARAGRLQKLGLDTTGLPDRLGNAPLADPDGYYRCTEMAGYGFVVNPDALAGLGLAAPADWSDLADPRYAGRIALPIPARVGFAPPMVEIVLQAWGWQAGWALWSEIAGNAVLLDRNSTFVTDEVASGRLLVGLSIDFFVASAIANGVPVRFAYPRHGGINPAQVAIPAAAPDPAGGRAFAAFVLSDAGQRLLGHPDIRKLPVRPAVYAELPAGYYNPFAAAGLGAFDYDGDSARTRLALSAALFEQTFVADHAAHAALWQRVHAAEAAGKAVAAARRALATVPLDEAAAADPALRGLFQGRLEGSAAEPAGKVEQAWRARAAALRAEADAALKEVAA
ncbi:extracellular solute-binding protein [Parasulfuritortus cantonensis]|uniref:Extracellular solute-binding protein n=1 Tax=Parasulfuritortus cantonensis TaxID=2528202 RepID=A0A4R1B5A3_9PROT|nr:extracellular solute-binding protein [Parasulfuritortus cantonensis]TCJ11657.1 extracellular solute-binding protein [Parasulfuritortus cantonensis]